MYTSITRWLWNLANRHYPRRRYTGDSSAETNSPGTTGSVQSNLDSDESDVGSASISGSRDRTQGARAQITDLDVAEECEVATALTDDCPDFLQSMSCTPYEWNAMLPINRLPPEIMSMIFLKVHMTGSWELPCLATSRTCSLWRRRALAYPLLWDFIDVNMWGQLGTIELLERSKGRPLYVRYQALEIRRAPLFLSEIWPLCVQRAGWLFLYLSSYNGSALEQPESWLLSHPAPNLQVLKTDLWNDLIPVLDMPVLFQGQAPKLTQLCMENHRISFASNIYVGLTKLEISSRTEEYNTVFGNEMFINNAADEPDFIHVLRNCPDLEELRLQFHDRFLGTRLIAPSSPVVLHRLKLLSITCPEQETFFVLNSIVISPSASVEIRPPGRYDPSPLLRNSRYFPGLSETRHLALTLSLLDRLPHLRITGFQDANPPDDTRGDLKFVRTIIVIRSGMLSFDNIIPSLIENYPMPSLQVLRIMGADVERLSGIHTHLTSFLLISLPQLSKFILDDSQTVNLGLWDSLVVLSPAYAATLLPRLRTIEIRKMKPQYLSMLKFFKVWPAVSQLEEINFVSCEYFDPRHVYYLEMVEWLQGKNPRIVINVQEAPQIKTSSRKAQRVIRV